jgi:predicted dehydrogenase
MDRKLRFALLGAGFWSRFQLAGWHELAGVECCAIYNRTRHKAEELARQFGVPWVYDDAEAMLREQEVDFVDIVTAVETHAALVQLAARHRLPVVCQKPMATSLAEAESMVRTCRDAGVPFFVHENWRWQEPIRQLGNALDAGHIGRPFRARITFSSSYPVFDNQPFLKTLDQFILTDVGSHILDTARFLFGEASDLYCTTRRIHSDIQGEDVATVLMHMGPTGTIVTCEMSYASRVEHDRFPETYIHIEGELGSLSLEPDCWLRQTTAEGTLSRRYPPPYYPWLDPEYALIHASIVPCNADILHALQGLGSAETTGADNLRTVQLIYQSYASAASGQALPVIPPR